MQMFLSTQLLRKVDADILKYTTFTLNECGYFKVYNFYVKFMRIF